MSVPAPDSSGTPGTCENEDAVAFGEDVVVVVDGAGLPAQLRAGCVHSVAWFARSIAQTFCLRLGDRSASMRAALGETIASVRDAHAGTCDLGAGSPSATVAAWRISGDHVEHLVLCDAAVLLVELDSRVTEVTDRRLQRVLDAVRDAGATDPRPARRAAVEAARNRPDGFWCVHDDPAAAEHAIEGRTRLSALSGVVACTDGATRAYELLRTHSVEEFAHAALRGDVEHLAAAVRREEVRRAGDLRRRGHKPHDDLTVVATSLTSSVG